MVKENEITDCMYMIHTGTVAEVAEDLEEQTELLHDDDNFGIVRFFQLTGRYKIVMKRSFFSEFNPIVIK